MIFKDSYSERLYQREPNAYFVDRFENIFRLYEDDRAILVIESDGMVYSIPHRSREEALANWGCLTW